MTATLTAPPPSGPAAGTAPRRHRLTRWHAVLAALGVGSATLYLWGLAGGARSEYYASVALSMSKSWSNFVFGAMDPAGTVSLDKIPGSFWIPALFVKAFGFSTWSVDAPNAIATAIAVVLVAITGRRLLGPTAGLVAGLVTATTPILAAVARTNQPQAFFVLGLALTAWAGTKAVQRGSLRWLVIAGVCVAAAFHTYMLEAWAVWPALGVAYLCTPQPWWRKVRHVLVAGLTSLGLSLTWILVVTLTPAADRPWVGGSNSNTAWEMVFGYNGLGRFGEATASADYRSFTPQFSGEPGLFRLFNSELAGQIGWLLPAAVVAVVVLILLKVSRPVTVFLGGWFVTMVAMFSVVAGMHQFYTSALAVPVGLLIGCAFAAARQADNRWAQIALVVSGAVAAVAISRDAASYLPWVVVAQVAVAVVAVVLIALGGRRPRFVRSGAVAAVAVAGMVLTPAAWAVDVVHHPNSINPVAGDGSAANAGMGGGGLARLFGGGGAGAGGTDGRSGRDGRNGSRTGGTNTGPASGQAPIGAPGAGGFGGAGGFSGAGGGFGGAGGFGGSSVNQTVLRYVEAHRGNATFLLATFGGQAASSYITATNGENVLPIGGFGSSDPTPTLAHFQELVRSGQLRFVLIDGGGGGGDGAGDGGAALTGATGFGNPGTAPGGTAGQDGRGGGQSTSTTSTQIRSWVQSQCTAVPSVSGLYDCAPTTG